MTYKTKEKRLAWMKEYYKRKPEQYEKHKSRMRKRKRAYERFKKEVCERCGALAKRCVHHSDRNHDNNDPNNLITLCRSCHMKEHRSDPENLFYRGKP